MDNITCPHCSKSFPMSDAIKHELEEKVKIEQRAKLKAEFEEQKAKEAAHREKELREEFEKENKENTKLLEQARKKQEELVEKLKKEQLEREKAEEKIKIDAKKEAQEEQSIKFKEKDIQMDQIKKLADDLRKANEDLKKKLEQGSQQLQGEALEMDLEDKLHETFPYDELKPVPKGVNGGDIVQEIKNKYGNSAGSILWETKRTKAWSKGWLIKLKDDMRKIDASDCILVTDILPPDVRVYDRIDNVWVTSYEYALKLASVVRLGLMNVAIAKSAASHTDEQLKDLYRVITSDSFRNKFEARDEIISAMQKELDSEKSSTERRWERQRVNIEKLSRNNSQLYGELQAHIPSLKPLNTDMLELDNGENN